MAYKMVTVKKKGTSPGMPTGKKVYVLVFDMDSVQMERDEAGVKITSFTVLSNQQKPAGIYVDQASIDAGDEVEGDAGARGYIHHVNFQHPGTELEIAEFKANNVNANLGVIVVPCDPSETTVKVYGTPCSPLTMQGATEEDTNEAHRTSFQLRTAMRTWPVGIMDKTLVPLSDDADVNKLLGLGTADSPSE